MVKRKIAKRIAVHKSKSVSKKVKAIKRIGKNIKKASHSVAVRQKVAAEVKAPEKRKGKVNINIPAQADAKNA